MDISGAKLTRRCAYTVCSLLSLSLIYSLSPSLQVQLHLYSKIAAEFGIKPLGSTGLDLRVCVGVSRIVFILREYYSVAVELTSAKKNSKIRPYLLLLAKEFATKVG